MEGRRPHHQFAPPPFYPQGGFRGNGAGNGGDAPHPRPLPHPHMGPPLSGQKRTFNHHRSPADGGGFAKLFVGSLPPKISEDEVRGLFGAYGNVIEVVFLKDKVTGLPQGCCFIKYATSVEAERAIRELDNKQTLPGGSAPLQVKFADGERDRSGPMEHKLFVGSLNKQATEQEIEEIFAPYGRVENIYVIRDEHKQSRGCAFVTFPDRDMAIAAISALNGVFHMDGCRQPIIVRFADPKRPRSGDQRFGGPGTNYSPRSYQGPGGPRGSGGPPMDACSPIYGWRQGGGTGGMGLPPQTGIPPLGTPISSSPRGPSEGPNMPMGIRAANVPIPANPAISGSLPIPGMSPQLSHQQGFNDRKPGQIFAQQIPLHQLQSEQHLSHPMHPYQPQSVQEFPLTQPSDTRSQQLAPIGQYSSPQMTGQIYNQGPMPHHPQAQQVITTMQQHQIPIQHVRQQETQPNQQPTMMQASQPMQHQVLPVESQMEQGTGKEASQQAYFEMTSQQPPVTMQPSWTVPVQQHIATSVPAPTTVPVPVAPAPATATCDWTEHTSPEGHKYYYNSSTGESRWEKPEELTAYEQQVKLSNHRHHHQEQPQAQNNLQDQQQLQPPLATQQYRQPLMLNPQSQHHLSTSQAMPNPSQQAQQFQHYHQPQLQQQQHILVQHQTREAQFQSPAAPLQYPQTAAGGSYQPPIQMQTSTPTHQQQLMPNQPVLLQQVLLQAPSSNSIPDQALMGQWLPAAQQQGLPNQEWMWKSKPSGA